MSIPISAVTSASPGSAIDSAFQAVASAKQLKAFLDNSVGQLQIGNISTDDVRSLLRQISSQVNTLSSISLIPGLDFAARLVFLGYSGSLSADITTTVQALQNIVTIILTDIPKDPSGFPELYQLNGDGSLLPRFFSAGQLSGLIPALQAASATIG